MSNTRSTLGNIMCLSMYMCDAHTHTYTYTCALCVCARACVLEYISLFNHGTKYATCIHYSRKVGIAHGL